MTLRKMYENDAWVLLEDYFDQIRDHLTKTDVKGEERQRVINELRSHVQLKADEIVDQKGIVSYAGVLEIMGELGSPVEIASSYSQDDDTASSVAETGTLSPVKVVIGKKVLERELSLSPVVNPAAAKDNVNARSSPVPAKTRTMTDLAWMVFQLAVFSIPLMIFLHITVDTFYYYDWMDRWYNYHLQPFYITYPTLLDYLNYFLPGMIIIFLIPFYSIIFLGNKLIPNKSRKILNYGLLSTMTLFIVSMPVMFLTAGLPAILLFILSVIMLAIERAGNNSLVRHFYWRVETGLRDYVEGNYASGMKSIVNIFITSLVACTGMIIILSINLFNNEMHQMPFYFLYVYAGSLAGLVLIAAVLLLNIYLNTSNGKTTIYSLEISMMTGLFRWFLALIITIPTITSIPFFYISGPYFQPVLIILTFIGWLVLVLLPVLLIEMLLIKLIRKTTGIECDSVLSMIKNFVDTRLRSLTGSLEDHSPTSEVVELQSIPSWKLSHPPVENKTGANITGKKQQITVQQDPVIREKTIVDRDQHGKQPPVIRPSFDFSKLILSWKESTTLSFIKDIVLLYLKVTVLVLFLLFVYIYAESGRQVDFSYDVVVIALIYSALVFIISSYKLYSLSRKQEHSRPWYYWLLVILSWIMMLIVSLINQTITDYGEFYYSSGRDYFIALIFIASPFIIIQCRQLMKL